MSRKEACIERTQQFMDGALQFAVEMGVMGVVWDEVEAHLERACRRSHVRLSTDETLALHEAHADAYYGEVPS